MSKSETMEVFGTELVIGTGTDSARVVCKAAWGSVSNAPLFDVFRSAAEERLQVTADLDRIAACYNALSGLHPSAVATMREALEKIAAGTEDEYPSPLRAMPPSRMKEIAYAALAAIQEVPK